MGCGAKSTNTISDHYMAGYTRGLKHGKEGLYVFSQFCGVCYEQGVLKPCKEYDDGYWTGWYKKNKWKKRKWIS